MRIVAVQRSALAHEVLRAPTISRHPMVVDCADARPLVGTREFREIGDPVFDERFANPSTLVEPGAGHQRGTAFELLPVTPVCLLWLAW